MSILITIASYLVAFVCLATIEFPFIPISMLTVAGIRRLRKSIQKTLFPLVTFALAAVKIAGAVLLACWLVRLIGGSPSWLMFIVPGFFMYWNDRARLRRAQQRLSALRVMLDSTGEGEQYDQTLDIWTERAFLGVDVLGWLIGTSLFLQSASFL